MDTITGRRELEEAQREYNQRVKAQTRAFNLAVDALLGARANLQDEKPYAARASIEFGIQEIAKVVHDADGQPHLRVVGT